MAFRRSSHTFLLVAALACAPLTSISLANALVPPGDGDGEDGDIIIGGSQGTGGSASGVGGSASATGGYIGVDAPPPGVYLNRYTYYVGEVITGQLLDCPDCSATGPIFLDSMGGEITGTLIYSDTSYGAFTFIPDAPLPVGTYSVALDYASTGFEVIDGEPTPPTYEAHLTESPHPVGDSIECQSTVPGYAATAYTQTRIDAALTVSIRGTSVDQYRYESSVDDAPRLSTSAASPLATFRQGDGEFCLEVFAIPYAGTPEFSLGTVCRDPDAELTLGVQDIPYGSLDSVLAVCELPPDGYMDEWCAYHAEAFTRHSCAGFVVDACVQARYECPEGDLPEWYEENGIDPDDPNAPNGTGGSGTGGAGTGAAGSGASNSGGNDGTGALAGDPIDDGTSSETGGCSCTTGISQSFGASNRAFLLFGLGGALIALRKRGRKVKM